ncbi:MAG: hypothetical protein RLZZ387_1389 [Chloroflexota bacterium]
MSSSHTVAPSHFRDQEEYHLGAAFSLEPMLRQSAWFQPYNRSEALENRYLVGAGTYPGARLPGVISSAIAADLVGAS